MTSRIAEITIEHLAKEDVVDLEERVGDQSPRRDEEEVPTGSQGEPVLFALTLIATGAALKAYVAHLKYKAALIPDQKLQHRVKLTRADGTVEEHELSYEVREGEKFSDAAVRELSTIPGLAEALRESAA